MNIDYNKNFLYNYNIFNKNNIGIGISTPKHILDINGNLNLTGNLNIGDNIYLQNILNKQYNVLHYNQLTDEIKPIELENSENNLYSWITENNQLDFNYLNNIDNIYYNYISSEYKLENITNSIKIYLETPIIITHLFIYKKDSNNKIDNTDLGILNTFTINNINIQKLQKYYYKLNSSIQISNIQDIVFITGLSTNCYVKLLGYYKFNEGNTWNSNKDDNNYIFVNKNINIGGINTDNNQLFVNGNGLINYNLDVNKNTISNICSITNNLNIKNNINIVSIVNNTYNLNINFKRNKLSIGTNNNNSFCNIGDNTEIDYNGNVKTKDYNLQYSLNLNNTQNFIKFKNNNIISFLEKKTILNNFIFNKSEGHNSTLNDIYLLIKNNLNISDINKEYLYVNGNAKITGNIDVANNINIINTSNILGTDINQNYHEVNIYTNNLNVNNKTIGYNINNNIVKTNLLIIPKYQNYTENIKPGLIYYNISNNKYSGFNNTKHLTFIDSIDNIDINHENFDSSNILVNSKMIIPKKYNTNIDNENFGRIQYNLNSLKCEIHNGFKFGSVEYQNNITEIENIYVENLNALKPTFHKRIINYTYDDELNYINIITNPNTQISIKQQYFNTIKKETLYQNNTLEHDMLDFYIDTICNNLIISNNRNNINMSYQIRSQDNSFFDRNYFETIQTDNIINENVIIQINSDGTYTLIKHFDNINIYNNIVISINQDNTIVFR